jgi:phosphate transport system permease protein
LSSPDTIFAGSGREFPLARPGLVATRRRLGATLVRLFIRVCGLFVLATTLLILGFLGRSGIRGMTEVGLAPLLFETLWKPEQGLFGGLPLIVGTAVSAIGAVVIGALPAVLAALWVVEFAPRPFPMIYRRAMEIAAATPSVVFGWLALVYLVPALEPLAHRIYGADALVGGEGLAASALLLGIMIAPTVALLSIDALVRVPGEWRGASTALGASHWQTSFSVILPSAWRGLIVAVFYGFARAAGETMAVQMVIGGARKLPENLFRPTTTISAQIVMDMQNARPNTPESDVLFSMALLLLALSTSVVLGTRFITRGGGVGV